VPLTRSSRGTSSPSAKREKDTVIANYNWFRYEGTGFYAYSAP